MTDRVANPVLIQMRAINAQLRAKIVEGLAVVPMVTLRDILKLMDTFDKEDPHAEEKVAYETLVALNQSLTTERNQLRKAVARLQLEISRTRAEKGETT